MQVLGKQEPALKGGPQKKGHFWMEMGLSKVCGRSLPAVWVSVAYGLKLDYPACHDLAKRPSSRARWLVLPVLEDQQIVDSVEYLTRRRITRKSLFLIDRYRILIAYTMKSL